MSTTGDAYWGRYGAAGILLCGQTSNHQKAILLQHRAAWSHNGGTWGLLGGARDSHETAEQTALREAYEEAGIPIDRIRIRGSVVTFSPEGTTWSYTTVVADTDELFECQPNKESIELRWVMEEEVLNLPLHPGFAASWPMLRLRYLS